MTVFIFIEKIVILHCHACICFKQLLLSEVQNVSIVNCKLRLFGCLEMSDEQLSIVFILILLLLLEPGPVPLSVLVSVHCPAPVVTVVEGHWTGGLVPTSKHTNKCVISTVSLDYL